MTLVAGGVSILALLVGLVIVVAVVAGVVWIVGERRGHKS